MPDRQPPAGKPPDQPPHALSALPTPRAVGERVRQARYAANMTQQDLAGTTFSKSYLSAVERGKMTPSFQALQLLAERLDVTRSSLLGEETKQHPIEAPEASADAGEQAARLREAEQVLQEGRYEEAIARFAQIGQHDRASRAQEQYAQFLAEEGRYQDAYEQLRLALQGQRG